MSSWPPASLRLRLVDLRDTTSAVLELPKDAPDLTKTCMARYLTVRSAGYLESVRDDAADLFVSRVALEVVTRRIRQGLRQGQGVAPSQLTDFLKSFHPSWSDEFESILDADDKLLRNRLGSLVSARKKIAHGDGDTVTVNRALQWSETAEVLGAWLVKRFDPARDIEQPVIH